MHPEYGEESLAAVPAIAERYTNILRYYNDSPYLSGMVSVALATGIAKDALRGKYFDVGQDLEDVLAQGEAIKKNPDLYSLHTSFLNGLANGNWGTAPSDEPFDFPGF